MADIAKTSNQNILPVQALFNLDGTFNTFIGQGQPFQITATEAIGLNNTTVNTTVYPTFTSVTSGVVTALSITSSALSFNPSTGILSSTGFSGALNGTATTATNLAGGIASQIPYQIANGQTAFIANGANGQVLTSNGTSVPSWQNPTSNIGITDDTSSATTEYVTLARVTTGSISTLYTSSSKLSYVSSTGTLSATTFNGALATSNLTGTTLPSSIVSSSLTSVGTITSGVWNGTAITNSYLQNSTITINGTPISLGGSVTVAAVAGSNTQIQYNNTGNFGANANFTYTGTDVNIPFGVSNSATSSAKIALALSMIA